MRVDFMLAAVRTAEERDEQQPEHVERGQPGGGDAHREQVRMMEHDRRIEIGVLGEEARQREDARDRERADQEGPEGEGQLGRQPAHLADVLFAAERVDHDARGHEQQRLEERVGHEVEDAGGVGADADRHDHIADLAHRRVREHALDVELDAADGRREQRGDAADDRDDLRRRRRVVVDGMRARDEIDARGHHGRGVDERAHRRRAFHRVGQPCLQGQLRRFRHRADEQPDADPGERGRARARRVAEHVLIRDAAEVRVHQEDGDHDADVADDVHDERFARREHRDAALVVKADEQV